ncbi:CinA family protein [Schaalia sp. ZJ1691]|uniref:CinA family protein n=1 Tax=Schaalia sp. ZJ1691 TaxID=2709404 RepID=UPI0013EBE425|nr:CinA family protein [Schaalia sp. ZJ1691]
MNDEHIADILRLLGERHETIATAESLTGGAVCARLVDIPGASAVVRGGICTYATDVKTQVLGVDAENLQRTGPVDAEVALDMARGVQRLLRASIGIATTGVAGPGPHDGHPAGTVYIACVMKEGAWHRKYHFTGERSAVRRQAVDAALELLEYCLATYSQ